MARKENSLSRGTANVTNTGITITAVQQLATYEDGFAHLIKCVGDWSEETTLILT